MVGKEKKNKKEKKEKRAAPPQTQAPPTSQAHHRKPSLGLQGDTSKEGVISRTTPSPDLV